MSKRGSQPATRGASQGKLNMKRSLRAGGTKRWSIKFEAKYMLPFCIAILITGIWMHTHLRYVAIIYMSITGIMIVAALGFVCAVLWERWDRFRKKKHRH